MLDGTVLAVLTGVLPAGQAGLREKVTVLHPTSLIECGLYLG